MSFSDSSSTSHAPRVCCQASEGLQTCTSILRLDLKLGTWRCPELNLKRGSSSLKSVSRISPVVVYPGQVLSYTPTFQAASNHLFRNLLFPGVYVSAKSCVSSFALAPSILHFSLYTPQSLWLVAVSWHLRVPTQLSRFANRPTVDLAQSLRLSLRENKMIE